MIITDNTVGIIEFTRLYLAVFYTFVAFFYISKIIWAKRSSGQQQVFPGQRFCTSWWNHIAFRVFRATIWMICVFRFFVPEIDGFLGLLPSMLNVPVMFAGNLLLTCGFVFTIIVHLSMGSQWRSGIDPKGPAQLMTHGFYRYSRNPMFSAIALSQLGFFLALPSLFSLICLLVGLFTLYRQAIVEEQHLAGAFPAAFAQYKAGTRRWL